MSRVRLVALIVGPAMLLAYGSNLSGFALAGRIIGFCSGITAALSVLRDQ